MDMSMTMPMATATATSTAAASSASSTAMSMSMGGGCKISMLWNWYTVDSCFIASSWRIRSSGMFAGSCIGVILLTMSLEFLRRSVKEYDRYLIRKRSSAAAAASAGAAIGRTSDDSKKGSDSPSSRALVGYVTGPFKPTVLEQAIRALLHMVQFGVAYFIMLLAMYYNGYIIICILIGAYLGAFVFHWEPIGAKTSPTSAAQEATVCCA